MHVLKVLEFISEAREENIDKPGLREVLEAGSVQLPECPPEAQGKVVESLVVTTSFLGESRHKSKGGRLREDGVVACVEGSKIFDASLTEALNVEEAILGLWRQDNLKACPELTGEGLVPGGCGRME